MTVTSEACRQAAAQLARVKRNAGFAGEGTKITVADPGYLIGLLRRAARELERS